jgi:hypothetical protein
MTKLLDEAIRKVRALPEVDQNDAAAFLLMLAARRERPLRLDADTRAAIEEAEAQARRGEFASDEQIAALFKNSMR